ncbi:MAG: hypothetical protein U1E47_01870 [Rivihabitans pingtungensis]
MEAPIIAEPTRARINTDKKANTQGIKRMPLTGAAAGAETLAMLRSFLHGGGFGLFASAQLVNQGLFGADFLALVGRVRAGAAQKPICLIACDKPCSHNGAKPAAAAF